MTKQEFQKRIGAEISQKDYSIVEHVYTWHPSISEVKGKEQIAELYKSFAELSREVMPVLDKLTEIAGQHGTAEKLVSITLSAEGYIHFTVHDSGMCLSRLKREDAPELEIRKQLSQEMGREEN